MSQELIMLIMTNQFYKNISLCFLFLSSHLIISAQDFSDVKIAIVHSEKTKQLLHKNDNNFYPILDWELLLLNQKLTYEVFEDKDLDNYEFKNTNVLILPSVEILSDQAMLNIRDFINGGGNLLVLGKLGSFDWDVNLRATDALEYLSELQISALQIDNEISEYHSFNCLNALSQDFTDNFSFLIINQLTPFYAFQIPHNGKALGSYKLNNMHFNSQSGIVAIEGEHSRILWFGFQLSQISSDKQESNLKDKLVLNAIRWLCGKPSAWVNSFPSFHESVTLFSAITKNQGLMKEELAPIFEKKNIPLNFFITPSEILDNYDELYTLASGGELNLSFDSFDYLNSDSARIEQVFYETSKILKNVSRQKYFGLTIVNPSFYNPLPQFAVNYFDFVLNDLSELVLLKDNEKLFSFHNILQNEVSRFSEPVSIETKNLQSIISEMYEEANAGCKIVTHVFKDFTDKSSANNIKIAAEELIRIAKDESYVTTYSKLLSWINSKSSLSVNIEDVTDESKIVLRIRNAGVNIIEEIGIVVSLPSSINYSQMESYDYQLKYDTASGYYRILIPFLLAGQDISIEISYVK